MHRGEYSVFRVDERTGGHEFLFDHHNLWLDTWGAIAARCVALGQVDYKISGLYVEFENVADPEDVVDVPDFTKDEGLEYYLDLSGDRDYLRIPIDVLPQLTTVAGFSMPTGEGNSVQMYATTQGVTGVNGAPFSDAQNSKIFGVAVVATPVWGDNTRDLVFARSYFPTDRQVLKQPSSQIALSYKLNFSID